MRPSRAMMKSVPATAGGSPGRPPTHLTRPGIAQLLGLGDWLISKVRVHGPERGRDAIDLVAAAVNAPAGLVEHASFGEDLVNGRAPTHRIVFTEDVMKIAGQ